MTAKEDLTSTFGLAKSLASVDTTYSADCIEFCPFEGFEDLFICGTYQIVKTEVEDAPSLKPSDHDGSEDEDDSSSPATSRVGRLLLYKIGGDQASL